MKKQLTIIAMTLFAITAVAQEENQFTVDAQLRTRGEYNNGAVTPRSEGEQPATYINNRARVSLGYQRKDNLEMKLSVQHTGIWGQSGINANSGEVAINEAWAKLRFGQGFFAQIGRQQLAYDDERILGGLDWHVAGNWHDALRLGYENQQNRLHMIVAFNQATANNHGNYYNGPMPYKSMQTLWYHYQAADMPLGISLLAMNLGREAGQAGNGKTRYMQTFGTDLSYKPSDFDVHGAFYYQTGKNPAGTKVSAWMASAKVGYQINPVWSVNAGYDYRSGNDGEGTKDKAFDQLFGSHHMFYGAMDYFTRNVPLGLHDIQAGVGARVVRNTNVQLGYHYFASAEKASNAKRGLGHEVDLQVSTRLMKDVTLMAGYSTMFGTETMDAVMGGNHKSWQDWAWVSFNINPRIFTAKW
ncbi:MAG: alginate export family protein [Bacteroidaceae bacterium]|nr:alginate export family protein [Bacteroidaceae bacterium]